MGGGGALWKDARGMSSAIQVCGYGGAWGSAAGAWDVEVVRSEEDVLRLWGYA